MLPTTPTDERLLLSRILLITVFFLFTLFTKTSAQVTYELEDFDGISVAGDISVILHQGDELRAEVDAHGIPEDKVSVKVDRGTLKIRLIESLFYRDEDVKIVVTYRKLREVSGHAGSYIRGESLIEADKFEAKATTGARVELEIKAEMLKANASEGGQLTLKGEVNTQNAAANTGGQYFALDLECNRTYVRAGAGGEAEVVANEALDAAANTGGTVEYRGNPEEKDTRVIIAGSVRKI